MFTEKQAKQKECPFNRENFCSASGCLAWKNIEFKKVTRKVYHGTDEHSKLNEARFKKGSGGYSPFKFDGHVWRYEQTSYDDSDEFDLISRQDTSSESEGICIRLQHPFAGDDF